ncbi:MAG: protein O-mannosyl-transferase family [Bacteroidota bacterium]
MSEKNINRLIGLGVFLVTLIVYLKTLSVTVVFWDVGEFCAASWLLQVPHPPGSPLFVIIARCVSMVPFYSDIAARMHSISAFAGAFAAAFTFFILVKLITRFRGEIVTFADRLTVYGASVIGAFAMAFSASFWDNSIEAEVYGLSMLMIILILWLALHWWERADEPHSEKYLILIAYIVGLSIGVHILSLLALFTIMMIVYFKRNDYSRASLIRFSVIAIPIFFVIYPGIVQVLPGMLDGEFSGITSDVWLFIPPGVTAIVAYYAYKSAKLKQKWINIGALSFLFIVIGYTTYATVLIRANAHTPMNENNPNNLARLVSYLGREQYGNTPLLKGESWDNDLQDYREKLFPRRWSQEDMHRPTRENYTSDLDFMWRYQIDHMFLRYLFQNYIGAEGDWQDAGVSWKDTWGIPFLIGCFGFYYHVRKDWKNFLPWLVMFIVMGFAFVFYANMQEPQPRERDYFYVGAFYDFCLWIGIGVVGLVDTIRLKLKNPQMVATAASGVVAFAFLAVPVNLLRLNYHEHDRSQDYVAWDYSYNLLQSCDQDAILFTNGDNDTFPLWYLQDVENVRTDVRIANLSLINTSWYIDQLKNETPHGTAKIPITLTEEEIATIQPVVWRKEDEDVSLAVPPNVIKQFGVTDSTILATGKMSWKMAGIPMNETMKILRVQDQMVKDIVLAVGWTRPLDFAVTCSPDSKIGLDNYLWMQGMVWRLKPIRMSDNDGGLNIPMMEANVMAENVKPSKTYQPGFMYRNVNNPNVYYDENITRMLMNYRSGFLRLAEFAGRVGHDPVKAKKVMDRMEQVIPLNIIPNADWRYTYQMMEVSDLINDKDHVVMYSKALEVEATDLLSKSVTDHEQDQIYSALISMYDKNKNYGGVIEVLNRLEVKYPNDQSIPGEIQRYQNLMKMGSKPDTSKK